MQLQLLVTGDALLQALRDCAAWAESFTIATPSVDSRLGKASVWTALAEHLDKCDSAYVALDGLATEPHALDALHARGALRLVPAADGSFRVHLLRFRRGEELRVVLGSGCFAPPGLVAPVEATLAWRGTDTDPFALQLESLLRRVAEQAHVPTTEELGTYGGLYFRAVEHRQALEEIAAPFVKRHERDHEIGELELVTDEKLIKRAVADFTAAFRAAASVHQRQRIGSAGGNFEDRVHYIPELGVWGCFGKNENRYWQGFGVDRPDRERSLGITVEINPPCAGIDRKIGGAIARERSTGALHLVHRGRIGGGRKGIGAELFWTCFRGGIEMTEAGRDEPARVVAVARIGAPSMARDVATFVHEVARIKRAAI